jgi:prevent-host-death family protein
MVVTEIGSSEAKTHLAELLDRVTKGEKFVITKRGMPVAMLVPPPDDEKKDVREVLRQMKALRKGNMLGEGLTVKDLIEEGRRSPGEADKDVKQVVKEILEYRDRHGATLDGITVRDLIEEGRRF